MEETKQTMQKLNDTLIYARDKVNNDAKILEEMSKGFKMPFEAYKIIINLLQDNLYVLQDLTRRVEKLEKK